MKCIHSKCGIIDDLAAALLVCLDLHARNNGNGVKELAVLRQHMLTAQTGGYGCFAWEVEGSMKGEKGRAGLLLVLH